ncbi:TPA: hypothetical protein QDB14_002539 [Burkholderia vietnamiensis]|nr:hypothetical protein [Burkholderia vietnamiensis]HEP6274469.1 hypothetical protein [Burkholderia vietnamiensis]HEP6283968.1 hypothetical protein [Burkholderia vietnamiensis]HEP6309434.1 hypothetical protein [Burkholderia vietnamiensis]
MATIRFDLSQTSRIERALSEWQRSLPKQPGQIGLAQIVWIEHPPIGEKRTFDVNEGFVDFLRQENIPFEIR